MMPRSSFTDLFCRGGKGQAENAFQKFFFIYLFHYVLFCQQWIGWGLAEPPGRWENASSPSPSCAAAESHWSKSWGLQCNCISYSNKWQLSELSISIPPLSPGFARCGSERHMQQPLMLVPVGVWAPALWHPEFGYLLNITKPGNSQDSSSVCKCLGVPGRKLHRNVFPLLYKLHLENTELLGFWNRCLISTWLARNDAVAQSNYIINLLEEYKAIKAVVMVCNLIAEL